MMRFLPAALLLAFAVPAFGQAGVNPSQLSRPATDSWPTYNGDYSGRRFSPLKDITDANVQSVSLAWIYRLGAGTPPGGSIEATPLQVAASIPITIPGGRAGTASISALSLCQGRIENQALQRANIRRTSSGLRAPRPRPGLGPKGWD